MIIEYIACLLIASNLIYVWFSSSFAIHLISKFVKVDDVDSADFNQVIDTLDKDHPLLADLLSCPVCLGTWVSLIVSSVICVVQQLPITFIPMCAFSIPAITNKLFLSKNR